jgi:hypothetical protein
MATTTITSVILIGGQPFQLTTTLTPIPASPSVQLLQNLTTAASDSVRACADFLCKNGEVDPTTALLGLMLIEALSGQWTSVDEYPVPATRRQLPEHYLPSSDAQTRELLRQERVLDCLKGSSESEQISAYIILSKILAIAPGETWMGEDAELRAELRIQYSRALWVVKVGPEGLAELYTESVSTQNTNDYLFATEALHRWSPPH